MHSWDLIFILPNLTLDDPSPFRSTSAALVGPAEAARVIRKTAPNDTGLKMLKRFRDSEGKAIKPSTLLVDSDAFGGGKPPADVLQAFRNCCAVVTAITANAQKAAYPAGGQWTADYTNAFDFYFLAPNVVGALQSLPNGVQREQPLEGFVGHSDPRLTNPNSFRVEAESRLLTRVLGCFEELCIKNNRSDALIRIVRAIAAASHAARRPADGVVTLDDWGFRLSLWISAFECLLHPGGDGDMDESTALRHIYKNVQWRKTELRAKKRKIIKGSAKLKSTSSAAERLDATWPQKVYDDIYTARCAFLHGAPIEASLLHVGQDASRGERLTLLAGALFGCVLRDFIDASVPEARPAHAAEPKRSGTASFIDAARSRMAWLDDGRVFEDALLNTRNGPVLRQPRPRRRTRAASG